MNILTHIKLADCKMQTTKSEQKIIKQLRVGTEPEVVKNPYSKVEVELSPEAVAIYDIIMGAYLIINSNSEMAKLNSNKTADLYWAARDIFIRNWPEHYMTLLD